MRKRPERRCDRRTSKPPICLRPQDLSRHAAAIEALGEQAVKGDDPLRLLLPLQKRIYHRYPSVFNAVVNGNLGCVVLRTVARLGDAAAVRLRGKAVPRKPPFRGTVDLIKKTTHAVLPDARDAAAVLAGTICAAIFAALAKPTRGMHDPDSDFIEFRALQALVKLGARARAHLPSEEL